MLHRWFAYSSIALSAWLSAASCSGAAQTLCMPGENIFCKCEGGNEGTKTCNPDGQSFDVCVDDSGDDCSNNPATTDVTTGPGSTSSSTSTGAGGAMTNLPLFSPCSSDGECKSGECRNEYCTLDCGNFHDCKDGAITGDCVRFDNDTLQICAPYCSLQTDCTMYGPLSACGGASALDDPSVSFAVCGDWGAALGPIPAGTDCTDTPSCSLGLVGYEEVCIAMKCGKGCLVATDCPMGKTCPSDGITPSMCQ